MTQQELINKLSDLEWEDFEVKEAKEDVPKSAWETVSAFSNSAGGWLVFGVKQVGQTFEVIELTNPEKIEQDFLATLRSAQKFNVSINPTCAKYNLDGKLVLAFYIPVSKNKPVYFNTQTNTFIRRGSADQKASKEEIDSLYRDQTFGTKTSELASRTSISNLRDKSIREYRDYMSRFNPSVSYNRMELDDFLVKMRIIDNETKQCTFAGLLFFGNRESIETFFPDFRVDLFEIPGTSNQDSSSRYTFRLSEDDYENLWEVYFECFKRLRKEVDVNFKLSAEGFGEELSPGLKAVREALVNMLMHADYFSPARPRVRIFTNHIEYYNPGGLPKPLKELKGKDLSIPRNPILAKLFRMVKLAENAGYGLDNIEHNWKDYNGTSVDYVLDFDMTILKFITKIELDNKALDGKVSDKTLEGISERFRKDFGKISERIRKEFGESIQETFEVIVKHPSYSAEQIANETSKTSRTVENHLSKLKDAGFIERKGPKLGGYWEVKNENE
jgi:ATP-dependent DNA helicase RecG